MDVICGAANRQGVKSIFSCDSSQVRPELGLQLRGNNSAPALRGEDAMHEF